jgi:hypothetical protein
LYHLLLSLFAVCSPSLDFVVANLYFNLVTGYACTGILIILSQTPIGWYCKKQSTVACATFDVEFVAANTATKKAPKGSSFAKNCPFSRQKLSLSTWFFFWVLAAPV